MLFILSILCFTTINIIVQIESAVKTSAVEDNDIAATESAIQNTLNKLFSSLKLKDVNQNLRLKHYSILHDFFYSITLQDHDFHKKITKLTKVDNTDNSLALFITQLSEVWNDDNKSDETADAVYVTMLIQSFLAKLDNLKEIYGIKNSSNNFDIHQTIIKILTSNDKESGNESTLDETNEPELFNTKLLNNNVTLMKFNNINNTNGLSLEDNVTIMKQHNYTNITDNIYRDEFWQPSGRRIYLGKSGSIKRFPFMASIHIFKKFHCAGSIIKSDLIITSASCLQLVYNNRFYRENPAFLSVMVGNTYFGIGDEAIPILEVYFHPSYDPKTLKNNLAIMRMLRHINFDKLTKKVKKIDFDKNAWALPSNTQGITVIGWGATSSNNVIRNPVKKTLSYSVLEFYPLRECQEIYSKEYVTKNNFCAGFISKGGGACDHDAGGPGISAGILVGVISFGSPLCGAIDAPTVFTKLGYYKEWIESIIKQKHPYYFTITTERPTKIITIPNMYKQISTFKTKPVNKGNKNEEPPYLEQETMLRSDQHKIFKDFLKSIFDSNEIKELEQLQDSEKLNYSKKTEETYDTQEDHETHEHHNTQEAPDIHNIYKYYDNHEASEAHDENKALKTNTIHQSSNSHEASETKEDHEHYKAPTYKTKTAPKSAQKRQQKSGSISKSKSSLKSRTKPMLKMKSKLKLKSKVITPTKVMHTTQAISLEQIKSSSKEMYTDAASIAMDDPNADIDTRAQEEQYFKTEKDKKLQLTIAKLINQIKEDDFFKFKASAGKHLKYSSENLPGKHTEKDASSRIDETIKSLLYLYKKSQNKENKRTMEHKNNPSVNDKELYVKMDSNEYDEEDGDKIGEIAEGTENGNSLNEEIDNTEGGEIENIEDNTEIVLKEGTENNDSEKTQIFFENNHADESEGNKKSSENDEENEYKAGDSYNEMNEPGNSNENKLNNSKRNNNDDQNENHESSKDNDDEAMSIPVHSFEIKSKTNHKDTEMVLKMLAKSDVKEIIAKALENN